MNFHQPRRRVIRDLIAWWKLNRSWMHCSVHGGRVRVWRYNKHCLPEGERNELVRRAKERP